MYFCKPSVNLPFSHTGVQLQITTFIFVHAEVLHVDHIRTDEKMYDFDCSKPGFVIKRIN